MHNVFHATTIPSLRRFWRNTRDYLRFILPEIAFIVGSLLFLLSIIRWLFFAR